MNHEKIIGKLIIAISFLLSSTFFTGFIEKISTITVVQKVFIYIYMTLLHLVIYKVVKRKKKHLKMKIKIKVHFLFAIISFLVIIANVNILLSGNTTLYIDYNKTSVEYSESDNIWISHIFIDDKPIVLNNINIPLGWTYNEEWDDVISTSSDPEILEISVPYNSEIRIRFAYYNSFSKETKIYNEFTEIPFNLEQDQERGYNLSINAISPKLTYSNIFYLFCGIFSIMLILYCIYFLARLHKYFNILYGILLFLGIKGVFSSYFDSSIWICSLLLILIVFLNLENIIFDSRMKKYFRLNSSIWILLLNIYISYSFVGHLLFMKELKFMININLIIKFLLFLIFIYPITYFIFYILECFGNSYLSKNDYSKKEIFKLKVVIFSLATILLLIFSLAFYPGCMTSDGVDQWTQALGLSPIYEAHTPLHTIFIMVCSKIYNSPFTVVIMHTLIYGVLLSNILTRLYIKGLSKKVIILISILVTIAPNNIMMINLISKNTVFGLVLMWTTYILFRIYDDEINFFKNPVNIVMFTINLTLLYLTRKNAFVAVFSIFIALLIFGVKLLKECKGSPILIIVLSALLISFIEKPIYNLFNVQRSDQSSINSSYGVCVSPIGALLNLDYEIPDDILADASKIMDLEMWKNCYNRYNRDTFSWNNPKPDYSNVTRDDVIGNYIKLLMKYPDVVIKDRLDQINLIWNVVNTTNIPTSRYAIGLCPPLSIGKEMLPELLSDDKNHNGIYYVDSSYYKLISSYIHSSTRLQIFDMIFWRGGLWVIIGLLYIVHCIISKKYRFLISFIPVVMTTISLMIAFGWQIYQYIWFIPLCIFFILLNVLTDEKSSRLSIDINKGN